MTVTSFLRRPRTRFHMSRRSSTSTPAVGSSRNRISGSCASALAIITRRFMPPDSVMILSLRLSQSDRSRSTFSQNAAFAARPNRPRLKVTVAQTDSKVSVVSSCGTRPIFVRAARRRDDAAHDVDEGGFAGAVRPEQGEDFALADRKVDPLEGLQTGCVRL